MTTNSLNGGRTDKSNNEEYLSAPTKEMSKQTDYRITDEHKEDLK